MVDACTACTEEGSVTVGKVSGRLDDPPIELQPEHVVQLAIADFNDRRGEINNRSAAQHVLINLNITAAGAIVGLVLTSDDPNRALLLLLVPVCAALAMLWAGHARVIRHIGWYIRYFIRPVVERDQESLLWRWELDHETYEHRDTARGNNLAKMLTFVVPMTLTFVGPPLFALFYTFEAVVLEGDLGSRTTYGLGLLMFLGSAFLLVRTLVGGDEPPPSRTSLGRRSGSGSDPS
jgi:translation initiation factor IF-1